METKSTQTVADAKAAHDAYQEIYRAAWDVHEAASKAYLAKETSKADFLTARATWNEVLAEADRLLSALELAIELAPPVESAEEDSAQTAWDF